MAKNIVPDNILLQIEKPARYVGNEINMVKKNPKDVDVRFAFCFPDVYEVGMSYLGMQILYYFLNRRDDTYCERVYAPWTDMEELMRQNNIPLFALESQEAINKFDIVAFTLQYEMSYTNIINMLDLAGIPIWSKDRKENDPIICAGGSCAYNPEPLADIIDFFYIGEGEVLYDDIIQLYKTNKEAGGSREDFLEKLLDFDGIYVPKFYDVKYKDSGEIESFKPNNPKAKSVIKKVIVSDLDKSFYPEKLLVPLIEIVHDRVILETFRGCIRGCRFCQAGMIYRPVREKSVDTLLEQAKTLVKASGHEEISLLSLSTNDYTCFETLADNLLNEFASKGINLSLPSLRIDAFSLELMSKIQSVRKSSVTFAPEAGTQRLRDVINKNLSEEEILNGCKLLFDGGWNRVKLYFMMGLPTETEEDLKAIGQLADKIVNKYFEIPKEERKKPVTVVLSTSCFVPKPFTPFQWAAQDTADMFIQKQKIVKSSITRKQVQYNYHHANLSSLEGVMARGDRRIGKVIYQAWKNGCKFDAWNDLFSYQKWLEAFDITGINPTFYANRQRDLDEILPWDHISIGVTKEFLVREYQKALNAVVTPNCRQQCSGCGAKKFGAGVCYEI